MTRSCPLAYRNTYLHNNNICCKCFYRPRVLYIHNVVLLICFISLFGNENLHKIISSMYVIYCFMFQMKRLKTSVRLYTLL